MNATEIYVDGVLDGLAVLESTDNEEFYQAAQQLVEMVLAALVVDGAHHKQWHLEQVLQILCGDKQAQQWLDRFKWDRGIAP